MWLPQESIGLILTLTSKSPLSNFCETSHELQRLHGFHQPRKYVSDGGWGEPGIDSIVVHSTVLPQLPRYAHEKALGLI